MYFEFSSELVVERALYYSMVRFSPSIEQQKQVYNSEANDVGVVRTP